MSKFLKWIYGNKSEHNNFYYNIDKVTVANEWNPKSTDFYGQGGLNFTNEENALRWISRGDTLYDVIIPDDAEVINVENSQTPNGIYRSNKIIVTNPRKVSDELTWELYKKSNMPELTYYKTMSALAMKGCYNTCIEIIKDKVDKDNIDLVINEYIDFNKPGHSEHMDEKTWYGILDVLKEIQSDLLISLTIDKEPFKKKLTSDKVINITGQTGSGKSTYALKYANNDDYLVIDTDEIIKDNRFNFSKGINREVGIYLREKYKKMPTLENNFDDIYNDILEYCSKYQKTIVIDSSLFHAVRNINILKGEIIIIRTCINTCYKRCIERYKEINPNCTDEELKAYSRRKLGIYKWYKASNELIERINFN